MGRGEKDDARHLWWQLISREIEKDWALKFKPPILLDDRPILLKSAGCVLGAMRLKLVDNFCEYCSFHVKSRNFAFLPITIWRDIIFSVAWHFCNDVSDSSSAGDLHKSFGDWRIAEAFSEIYRIQCNTMADIYVLHCMDPAYVSSADRFLGCSISNTEQLPPNTRGHYAIKQKDYRHLFIPCNRILMHCCIWGVHPSPCTGSLGCWYMSHIRYGEIRQGTSWSSEPKTIRQAGLTPDWLLFCMYNTRGVQ